MEYSENNMGYCNVCREWTHDCAEPDARNYLCGECKTDSVFGGEEAVMMGLIIVVENEESLDE